RVGRVAAADGDPARQEDPRDAGETGAADADQVHPAEVLGDRDLVRDEDLHLGDLPAASSTMRASRSSASRGMSRAAAAPICSSLAASVASGATVEATYSGVKAESSIRSAPPASTT